MTVIAFPTRLGPRQSARRLSRRSKCPVVALTTKVDPGASYRLYKQASAIDHLQPRLALTLYVRALHLDPSNHCAMTNLGNIHFRLGDMQLAEVYYRNALARNPRQPESLYNLGYMQLDKGRPADAKDLFERALMSDPDFADCHFNHALACQALGQFAHAITSFERYLELAKPGDAQWIGIATRNIERLRLGT